MSCRSEFQHAQRPSPVARRFQIGSADPKEPKPLKYTAAQVAGLEKWKGKLNASMEENEELMKMLSELPPAVRRGLKDEEAALKQCRKEIQQQQSQCEIGRAHV